MKRVVTPDNTSGQRADRRALAEINDLIDDGVYDAASVLAWEIQRETPGDPTVWLLLARIDYLRERYAAAMYAARMATRLDPSSAAAWFALASTAVTRSRWRAEGLDAALQATALAPGKAKHWTVLAQLQLAGGAQYEAAVSAERAVRVDPAYRGGHLMLGEIALEAGEWRHAEAAFRAALELDASDRDARDGLAEALEAQDRDPDVELARYGSAAEPGQPAAPRARGADRALPAGRGDGAPLRWGPPLPVVAAGALAAGLLLGIVVPGLGVVRSVVGAVAVILMWVALRPTRPSAGPRTRTDADRQTGSEADGGERRDHLPPAGGAAVPADEGSTDAGGDDRAERAAEEPGAVAGGGDRAERAAEEPGAVAGVDGDEHSDEPAEPASSHDRPAEPVGGDVVVGDGRLDGVMADDQHVEPRTTEDDAHPAAAGSPSAEGDRTREPASDTTAGHDIEFDIPDDPVELAELSRARLAAADVELAHAAASRLEAVAPGSIEAHRALGAVALAEHDYEQARLHYGRVLEIEPLDQEAHERVALASEGMQRTTFRLPLRGFRGRR